MGLFKPDAPEYPELTAGELRDQTQAMLDVLYDPSNIQKTLEAERTTRPEYLRLGLQDIWGTTIGYGGQKGTLDLLESISPRLSAIEREAMTSQREADVADVERLGARATEALRSADPEMQKLLGQQGALTSQLFGMANRVTPQQERQAAQQARAAGMARGRGYGEGTMAAEILGREDVLAQRRNEAQQSGSQYFQMLRQTAADPFQAILGRPSQTVGLAQQQQGFGAGAAQGFMGPQLFDPNMATNLVLQNQANQANYNANVYGAQAGAAGSIWGGLFSGIGSAIGMRG